MKLELSEIPRMRHALGINEWRTFPDESHYVCHRNYYCARGDMKGLWEGLVNKGFAKRLTEFYSNDDMTYYSVSENGIKALEKELNATIEVID